MDTYEEMSRERYESKRDASAPRCRKCHQSENQVVLVCCAVRTCGEFLCERFPRSPGSAAELSCLCPPQER